MKQIFVCECHLIENARMVSAYMVLGQNRREARLMMRDGDHIVDAVRLYGDYVLECGWTTLTPEKEEEFLKSGVHCIFAGT